ncbi:MAG: xanthine dehydrogenase FAD-binding subunit XdhB [Lachnospiraceae bacterium]|nr:xanthine dehydrogenase FAD-binding subunit XdhB [Lachnospiraceae bacterium]
MYDIKALYEAKSVENAIELMKEHPEAKIIAGGSDVLIKIREGKMAGCELVSIYGLDELRGVSMAEDGTLRIGSLTSFSHITKDPLIKKYIGVLGEAVDMVGGPQIRAIGTIGGNTCNGVTSADSASTLLAWDAIVELNGPEGVRTLPLEEFYLGPGKVDLKSAELQTALLIPKESYENCAGFYIKYGMRNAMEIATTGCSVNVRLSSDKKTLERLRIGFGVAGPVPRRARKTEEEFKGASLEAGLPEKIGDAVLKDVEPRDSWRASKDMRLHLCSTMTERAFIEAVSRCGGEIPEKA